MRVAFALMAVAVSAILPARLAGAAETLQEPKIERCNVRAKTYLEIPAQDPGVLESVDVVEGETVRKGYLVAKIDATEPKMKMALAEFEKQAAEKQAQNDINVRYAKAQADVAKATYEQKQAANKKMAGTVTLEELRKVWLDWQRTKLSIEQAQFDMAVAAITAQAKAASVTMEEKNIERRQIKSPIDGRIEAIAKQTGEWVSPGDTIFRIIDLSVLRVEGFLNAAEYDPRDVFGRRVTVEVELAHGRKVTLEGKVTFVSSEVQTAGEFPIWAEVQNRQEDGNWILRTGLTASMVIHVGEPIADGRSPAASSGMARLSVSTSRSSRLQASSK
jgi:multidrug efflux pump subunit AcrA (membrane-fusion protein)